ncbi:hypothetical protein NOCPBOIH_00038 [African swine fever virus]
MSTKKKPTITKQELYSLVAADTQLNKALIERIYKSAKNNTKCFKAQSRSYYTTRNQVHRRYGES